MGRNIVPVVMGGANYEDIAPEMSFIDARKYSPKVWSPGVLRFSTAPPLVS